MATTADVLTAVPTEHLFNSNLFSCRRCTSQNPSCNWPCQVNHKMMSHGHSSSTPHLERAPSQENDNSGFAPTRSPAIDIVLPGPFHRTFPKREGDFSHSLSDSEDSAGYSSGDSISSGDSGNSAYGMLFFRPACDYCPLNFSRRTLNMTGTERPENNEGASCICSQKNVLFSTLSKSRYPMNGRSSFYCPRDRKTSHLPKSSSSAFTEVPDTNGNLRINIPYTDISTKETASAVQESPLITNTLSKTKLPKTLYVKEDRNSRKRVKDSEGYIRRAACVCVNEDESKVVLISGKYEGGGWLVPGGGLEAGEEEEAAAQREAWEEAGVTGNIQRCLGIFQKEDERPQKRKRTVVYVLKVTDQHQSFPEARLGRSREWFSVTEAMDTLSSCRPHQIAYLQALVTPSMCVCD